MLRLRKHADRSAGRNPDGTWPLKGVTIEVDKSGTARMTTETVAQGKAEGWITTTGDRAVVRPGGPVGNELLVTHTFVHYDTLTIHTLDGDVEFEVTHQPDKYADHAQANPGSSIKAFKADDDTEVTDEMYAAGATRVDWFYDLKKVGS